MYDKYLRILLLAVRRIKMAVSGVHIYYHRSAYIYLYVDTDELRRGSFSLPIHLWNILQNGVSSRAHFAITNNSKILKF